MKTYIEWWRHQMETFYGNHRSPVNSPHKVQWRGAFMLFLSAPEPKIEQTIEKPVIWDAIALIMTSWCWHVKTPCVRVFESNCGIIISHIHIYIYQIPKEWISSSLLSSQCIGPITKSPGDCLNTKISSYQYGDPHVKDKTILRPSHL